MWEALYRNCEIITASYPGYQIVPVPTELTIAQFEKTYGIPLPASYRAFILTFGPGELGGFFRIATPLDIENDYELNQFNKNLHGLPDERLLEGFEKMGVIEKFLFFCASGGGEFYGWKTDEVVDSANNEYAIYEFPDFPPIKKIALTFREFILNYVMRPDPDRNWTPELIFRPVQVENSGTAD